MTILATQEYLLLIRTSVDRTPKADPYILK